MLFRILLPILLATTLVITGCTVNASPERAPNVIVIMADDLGWAEVGCYGQRIIKTPCIDAFAAQGVRFTNAYSGSPVCAPSRCVMLTGLHTGHAALRDNRELAPEGQEPLPSSAITIASLLRGRGYATGLIGKWGLGPIGTSGEPSLQGFDTFFGYICQRHAHNYYPPYLYRNADRIEFPGNSVKYPAGDSLGRTYAPDLFRDEAVSFIHRHKDNPFLLVFATPVPHLALQVPAEQIAPYREVIPDGPYDGKRGYLPHPEPRRAYAAMVSRMDHDIGVLLSTLDALDLTRHTIVVFTSDNGPSWIGGTDSAFFNSTGGLRGRKSQLYEGGIRVPLIVRWPTAFTPGTVCDTPVASWDLLPTIAAVCGFAAPAGDGIKLQDVVAGRTAPRSLYWEFPEGDGWQAARIGDWKAVRRGGRTNAAAPIELYDLASDPLEITDLARSRPDVVAQAAACFNARTTAAYTQWEFSPVPLVH